MRRWQLWHIWLPVSLASLGLRQLTHQCTTVSMEEPHPFCPNAHGTIASWGEINYSIWKLLKRPHSPTKALGIKMHLFEFLVDIEEQSSHSKQTKKRKTTADVRRPLAVFIVFWIGLRHKLTFDAAFGGQHPHSYPLYPKIAYSRGEYFIFCFLCTWIIYCVTYTQRGRVRAIAIEFQLNSPKLRRGRELVRVGVKKMFHKCFQRTTDQTSRKQKPESVSICFELRLPCNSIPVGSPTVL